LGPNLIGVPPPRPPLNHDPEGGLSRPPDVVVGRL
jgi:hypothetical protein